MRTTFHVLLLFAVFVSEVLGFVTYSSSSGISSRVRKPARCSTRLSNDESGEALEQAAAKLRKEVADLEKELAKGQNAVGVASDREIRKNVQCTLGCCVHGTVLQLLVGIHNRSAVGGPIL